MSTELDQLLRRPDIWKPGERSVPSKAGLPTGSAALDAVLREAGWPRLVGIVTGRQRPGTTTGVVFITLEEETGNMNVIVWRDLQDRFRELLLKAKLLLIKGVVETDHNVTHVIAGELIDCSHCLDEMRLDSRDFH